MYNLDVADFDTYFVGEYGVLVHNQCTGKWENVNESMSETSRTYQEQITGRIGQAWVENGVKFDGMSNGVLIDAKARYSSFINKSTGEFRSWFSGSKTFVEQAHRQLNAAQDNPIYWYFMECETMQAVKKLFEDCGITGINFIFEPLK